MALRSSGPKSRTRLPPPRVKEFGNFKTVMRAKLQEPQTQCKLILVIVSTALLLDNMLYMVIVPIIPDYLRYIETNATLLPGTGILFASKAIVQLMVNPFSGVIIDHIGYDISMMIGLSIMFFSTVLLVCGPSYGFLFFARSLQGVGSAFVDTSGLAMIVDRFTDENERSKALEIALTFISLGYLVGPAFEVFYQFVSKETPFLVLAFISLLDGLMMMLVMEPRKKQQQMTKAPSIPIWRLFMDQYIAICAGAMMMSNVALAFLGPTISHWVEDNLTTDNWKVGIVFLPAFFPHVVGVILTVRMAKKYPHYQWLMAVVGLVLEGLCCSLIPFVNSYKLLIIPICGICFGNALVNTALLPTMTHLVDVRYVSAYGSVYAIADISYSVAYAVGPIIAGGLVEVIGFTALTVGIAASIFLYSPVLVYLKHIYDFVPLEDEVKIFMIDPLKKK